MFISGIAKMVFRSHKDGTWLANGKMIKERFRLTDYELLKIKEQVRELAIQNGTAWLWNQKENRYFCPNPNEMAEYNKAAQYQINHWFDENKALKKDFTAMRNQGVLTDAQYSLLIERLNEFENDLKETFTHAIDNRPSLPERSGSMVL